MNLVRSFAAAWLLLTSGPLVADVYILDRVPIYTQGTTHSPVRYEAPSDPNSCTLYLDNLQFFARRNHPMSCSRPIAPNLEGTIQHVGWENLSPDEYPELFENLVGRATFSRANKPNPRELLWHRQLLKDGSFLFRRARTVLRGHPMSDDEFKTSEVATYFHIVQYGANTIDPGDQRYFDGCTPKRGGPTNSGFPILYIVSADHRHVYGDLSSMAGGASLRALISINGLAYVEEMFSDGSIRLNE